MSAAESNDFNIQVVDLQGENAAEKFAQSLKETGFAVLKNHSIPQQDITALYDEWKGFFESKIRHDYTYTHFTDPEVQQGFFPMRSENAKGSKSQDLKRFYHYYAEHKDKLPALPEGLQERTDAFYRDMSALGTQLLGWLDAQTPQEVKERFSCPLAEMPGNGSQTLLRVLQYPALEGGESADEMRAAAHEDINLITLLVTGSEPGLQAQDTDGNWHDVPCDASYITVNAGDMLQMASDGYYRSTPHRVVNPEGVANVDRFSAPVFVHAAPDTVIDTSTGLTQHAYLQQRLAEIGLVK